MHSLHGDLPERTLTMSNKLALITQSLNLKSMLHIHRISESAL